ncbi:MAG TPA: hypothetical protein VNY27_11515 [Solirubrobacteraceae bacterium]|nr:hypothetical protein [Solirubrobacteraceae bacterium]
MAAGLLVVWLLADPHTPDLAAQVYRLGLYERAGLGVFDEHWYAGHALPGYSLLFGPLASLLGMRALAVVSVLVSVALFERIVLGSYGDEAWVRLGACLFAVAAVGDVWSGRLTFALGVAPALVCVYALTRERLLVAPAAAAVCAAASPVAGVLLALAALSYALARRAPLVLLAVGAPVVVVVGGVRALFPEGGYEPYPATSFVATAIVVCVFLWSLPRGGGDRQVLRVGAVVYLVACVLCLAVRTPMGSNIERYGVLLAGALLLCGLAGEGTRARARRGGRRRRFARRGSAYAGPVAVGVAVCVASIWIVWGPVRETRAVAGSAATQASYYAPVERYLAEHGAGLERVEVPLTRSHWEAAMLAPSVSLARGWEKQLDERYDAALLGAGLTAAGYRAWLKRQAVAYVALPDVPLDSSSAREGQLIRGGLEYLRPVWASRHWRVYAVSDATPLLEGPGRLTALGGDTFALYADAPGRLLARVHYTRYDTVVAGHGCVASAPGGWTYVQARAPGEIVVGARFSLSRALGLDGACH